jgi:uncharacterized cysteine cluster protein YcgN (CxxCxxCC family)
VKAFLSFFGTNAPILNKILRLCCAIALPFSALSVNFLIEDEDTNEIYFTDVACRYLDEETCQCPHYKMRQSKVPDCLTIYPNWGKKFLWLPTTCAYRLLSENKPLFDWHPLISGDVNSVHLAGSVDIDKFLHQDNDKPHR